MHELNRQLESKLWCRSSYLLWLNVLIGIFKWYIKCSITILSLSNNSTWFYAQIQPARSHNSIALIWLSPSNQHFQAENLDIFSCVAEMKTEVYSVESLTHKSSVCKAVIKYFTKNLMYYLSDVISHKIFHAQT